MSKILIAYATAGIGHKKASLAIKSALESKRSHVEIKIIDVLDYANPFFKKSYPTIYLFLVNRLMFLWGFFYYLLDFRIVHFLFYNLRVRLAVLNSPKLIKFLLEFKPDAICATHFLMADICTYLKRKYNLKTRVISVITDYRLHSFWISESVDTYLVGHRITKEDLVRKWKIPYEMVRVTGIPVEHKFFVRRDKTFFREKLGIPPDSFTILVMGGGYGIGPIWKIIKALNKIDEALSIICVCGHNKRLYNRLNVFMDKAAINIKSLGYIDNVDELMAASDLYIGKAGGINTTEALASDLPLIIAKEIPGQEKRNTDLIIKIGAGIRLKKIRNLTDIINGLRYSDEKIELLKNGIRNMKKENASSDIASFLLSSI